MKKIHLILVAVSILAIAAVLVFSPGKAVSQKQISQSGCSMPDSVAMVLRNSCSGCHGDGGNGMAMAHWNFSSWDSYAADKQAKKASAICNAITKGSMPPGSVKRENPGKIPTAAQTDLVCKWATSLQVK